MSESKPTKKPNQKQTTFSRRLRSYFEQRGIRFSAAARAIGAKPMRVSRMLDKCDLFRIEELQGLAAFLHMSVDELLSIGLAPSDTRNMQKQN